LTKNRQPTLTDSGRRAVEAERDRLAAALRDNLRKRKAQQRARAAKPSDAPVGTQPTPKGDGRRK